MHRLQRILIAGDKIVTQKEVSGWQSPQVRNEKRLPSAQMSYRQFEQDPRNKRTHEPKGRGGHPDIKRISAIDNPSSGYRSSSERACCDVKAAVNE